MNKMYRLVRILNDEAIPIITIIERVANDYANKKP